MKCGVTFTTHKLGGTVIILEVLDFAKATDFLYGQIKGQGDVGSLL
jgi:hypothetical protein